MAHKPISATILITLGLCSAPAAAQQTDCPATHAELQSALRASVKPAGGPANGGLENHQWGSVVDGTGTICAVAYSGQDLHDQWLGSRAISAEKATTALAFALPEFALSTANLFAGTQPGGFLYGLPTTYPARPDVLNAGAARNYGTADDPMVGKVSGGIVVFGGGLPLYDEERLVGGLGVSGGSSCADHNVAWRVRQELGLGTVPAGVSPDKNDAIIYDLRANGKSASGYGHVMCNGNEAQIAEEIGAGFVPEWKQAQK